MHKVGISLCGGGARGIAHIGVLQALEENGIYPEVVAGTSAGSIVGAFYAAGLTPMQIMEIVNVTSLFKIFKIGFSTTGLTDLSYLEEIIKEKFPENNFGALKKQYYACVTNISDGECEYIEEGELSTAVMASCSIPLIFKPVKINNKTYIDGGYMDNMPTKPLKNICQHLIAVNVNNNKFSEDPENVFAISQRLFDITIWRNSELQSKECDLLIDIQKAANFGLFDFNKGEELFKAGYEQTIAQMPELKAVIGN